jgi:hypothetical protein
MGKAARAGHGNEAVAAKLGEDGCCDLVCHF